VCVQRAGGNLGEVVGEFRTNVAAVAGFINRQMGEIWVCLKVRSGPDLSLTGTGTGPDLVLPRLS
jgi:hypothetical protein